MSRTGNRRDHPLPVTSEVGGEGGSYADATLQVATFCGPAAARDTRPGHGGMSSVATQAIRSETIGVGGASSAPDPDSGTMRYPTEAPDSPYGLMGRRMARAMDWRMAALGAALGASLAFLLRRR